MYYIASRTYIYACRHVWTDQNTKLAILYYLYVRLRQFFEGEKEEEQEEVVIVEVVVVFPPRRRDVKSRGAVERLVYVSVITGEQTDYAGASVPKYNKARKHARKNPFNRVRKNNLQLSMCRLPLNTYAEFVVQFSTRRNIIVWIFMLFSSNFRVV